MASDISLAVGNGTRRMTYAELAQPRGISLASARRLTRRHGWPRQAGNDGVVRVAVPLSEVKAQQSSSGASAQPRPASAGPGDPALPGQPAPLPMPPAGGPGTEILAQAIDSLREQLAIANGRTDRAEWRLDEERSRADRIERLLEEARTQITDAVGAERIAAGEAAALRAELERRREWRLLRRLRWALRGDR